MVFPLHFTLRQRKAFALKSALARTLQQAEAELETSGYPGLVESIRGFVDSLAKRVMKERCDQKPLDSYLRSVAGQVEAHVRNFLQTDELPAPLSEYLLQFRATLEGVECRRCHEDICDGTEKDHAIVDRAGLCIYELKQVAAGVLNEARTTYTAAGAIDAASILTVSFSTRYVASTRTAHGISGATFFRDSSQGRHSDVQLSVAIENFDHLSLATIPYVLYHEAYCHAFEGVATGTSRIQSEADDSFAEGWMDWVAFQLFESAFESSPDTFPPLALEAAVIARQALAGNVTLPGVSLEASLTACRQLGRAAADRFYHAMADHSGDARRAGGVMLQLSLRLNANRVPEETSSLQAFVMDVYYLLGRSARAKELWALVAEYLRHGEARTLFSSVARLRAATRI